LKGTVQEYGTFDEIVRCGLDPSELLKNEGDKVEKPEAPLKSPPLLPVFDRLMSTRSDRLTVDTPTSEGYIQGSVMDLRDLSESLSIHTTVSTQDVHKVYKNLKISYTMELPYCLFSWGLELVYIVWLLKSLACWKPIIYYIYPQCMCTSFATHYEISVFYIWDISFYVLAFLFDTTGNSA